MEPTIAFPKFWAWNIDGIILFLCQYKFIEMFEQRWIRFEAKVAQSITGAQSKFSQPQLSNIKWNNLHGYKLINQIVLQTKINKNYINKIFHEKFILICAMLRSKRVFWWRRRKLWQQFVWPAANQLPSALNFAHIKPAHIHVYTYRVFQKEW